MTPPDYFAELATQVAAAATEDARQLRRAAWRYVRFLAVLAILGLVLVIVRAGMATGQERVVNKGDTDRIFSLTRGEWNAQAGQISYPAGWKVRLSPLDTGTTIMAIDPTTRTGLSVQPLFSSAVGPPDVLVVGSYYPAGTFRFDEQMKREIEAAARLDLGPAYAVRVTFSTMPTPAPGVDVIEVIITRAGQ